METFIDVANLAAGRSSQESARQNEFGDSEVYNDSRNIDQGLLEVTYVFPISGNWQLQPDLQWVVRPGAAGSYPNALVIGLRSILTF